jgi:hypothetical protein
MDTTATEASLLYQNAAAKEILAKIQGTIEPGPTTKQMQWLEQELEVAGHRASEMNRDITLPFRHHSLFFQNIQWDEVSRRAEQTKVRY